MYRRYTLKINKNVYGSFNIVQTPERYKSKCRISKKYWSNNDSKLLNNISRAKNEIFNICNYNEFGFFYTQTISSSYDRTDLKRLIRVLNQTIRYIRKHYSGNFYYLVIPEFHEDEKSFHLHGFLSPDFNVLKYKNQNGFWSIKHLDHIGFNSVTKIRSYLACIKYMGKYITKDLATTRGKNERIFYCSQNLLRNNVVNSGTIQHIAPIHYDFKNGYCFKTTISLQKYYNLITKLDNDAQLYYIEDIQE